MTIKLDLSKVYDTISWEFLEFMLQKFHFPHRFILLIMRCVSSVSFSISCNGLTFPSFVPSRGLRLGDPLSPLLFVICCLGLSHLISHYQQLGNWKGIHFGHHSLWLLHMVFADDIVLFGEGSHSNANNIKHILDLFILGKVKKPTQLNP